MLGFSNFHFTYTKWSLWNKGKFFFLSFRTSESTITEKTQSNAKFFYNRLKANDSTWRSCKTNQLKHKGEKKNDSWCFALRGNPTSLVKHCLASIFITSVFARSCTSNFYQSPKVKIVFKRLRIGTTALFCRLHIE